MAFQRTADGIPTVFLSSRKRIFISRQPSLSWTLAGWTSSSCTLYFDFFMSSSFLLGQALHESLPRRACPSCLDRLTHGDDLFPREIVKDLCPVIGHDEH